MLDLATIAELDKTKLFGKMSRSADENEHSLEMHLPYIYKMLAKSVSPAPEMLCATYTL